MQRFTTLVKKHTVNIGILGLGTVGAGVVDVLKSNKAEIERRSGKTIDINSIAVNNINKKRNSNINGIKLTKNAFEIVNNKNIDIVLELIGGIDLAKELVTTALKNNKHVITANKALIAIHGNELLALAKNNNSHLLFEASVAGGIPIIKSLKQGLSANQIELVAGIINGTSNFILSNMNSGNKDFDNVLIEAQNLGYAEANSAFDTNGIDAAHKLAILSSIAFGSKLQFDKITIQGIDKIKNEDIAFASELGYVIKHLGLAKKNDNKIEMRVHPTLIPKTHLLANVNGVMNAVLIKGNALGSTIYYGAGAGGKATACAVIADLIDIIKNTSANDILGWQSLKTFAIHDAQEVKSIFYLHLLVADKPGVLADITVILASHNISVEKVVQKQVDTNNNAHIAIITNKIKTIKINKAVADMQKNNFIQKNIKVIHVETLE